MGEELIESGIENIFSLLYFETFCRCWCGISMTCGATDITMDGDAPRGGTCAMDVVSCEEVVVGVRE